MTPVQITIRKQRNGRRAAFYRTVGDRLWYALPIAQAERALRDGFVWIGVHQNIPVVAA